MGARAKIHRMMIEASLLFLATSFVEVSLNSNRIIGGYLGSLSRELMLKGQMHCIRFTSYSWIE